jgi:O-antigen ligase
MPPSSFSDDFDRMQSGSGSERSHRHHHHHHHHHHSHHRHHLARYFDKAFALAACLLLGWTLIPLASVGFFETRLVAIGAWLLAALACLVPRGGAPLPGGRFWVFLAAAMALWCGFQLIPLPAGSFPFWRGDSAVFAQIAAHASGRLAIAVVPYEAFHTALHWAGLFALACAAAHRLRTPAASRILLAGCILLALLECAFSLAVNIGPSVRLRGTFANPDAFGGFLAMTLPLTAAILLDRLASAPPSAAWSRRRAAGRVAWVLALATAFLAQLVILFFTGSRGATASAAIALAILLAWCWKAFPARRKAIAGGILLLACLFPVFFIRAQRLNVWERATAAETSLDSDLASRRHIWESGLALVRHFPFGTGPGGSVHAMPLCQGEILGRYRLDYAHNDTLQFLGDLGTLTAMQRLSQFPITVSV